MIRVSGLTLFSGTVDTVPIRNVCLLRKRCTKINPRKEQIFSAGCAASAAWLCWCLTQDRHSLSHQLLLPFWVRARAPVACHTRSYREGELLEMSPPEQKGSPGGS